MEVRCGLVNSPVRSPAGAQQRFDHPRGRGLAVRPGDVDDRAGPLRVAEQVREVGDPVQGRVDGVLGPAVRDLPLDLGQAGVEITARVVASHPGSLPAGLASPPSRVTQPQTRTNPVTDRPGANRLGWSMAHRLPYRGGNGTSIMTDRGRERGGAGAADGRAAGRGASGRGGLPGGPEGFGFGLGGGQALPGLLDHLGRGLGGEAGVGELALRPPHLVGGGTRSFSIRRRSAATSMAPAVSSSTVTPSACTDPVGANPSAGADRRSSARMLASCPASGVRSRPASAAATRCPGRSPWSDRNLRTWVTSRISEAISASASGSRSAGAFPGPGAGGLAARPGGHHDRVLAGQRGPQLLGDERDQRVQQPQQRGRARSRAPPG